MAGPVEAEADVAPGAAQGRELRLLRAWFAPAFFAGATALLGSGWLVGLVGPAPAVVAALLLAAALGLAGLAGLRARLDRWFWLIRWKLAVSYTFIAFVPLLLVTGMLSLLGYLATGQFLTSLALRELRAMASDVDEVLTRLDERTTAIRSEPDLGQARKLANGFEEGDELRLLRRRHQPDEDASAGKYRGVDASLVGLGADPASRFDFPGLALEFGESPASIPEWRSGDTPARTVLRQAGTGGQETLQVRGARLLGGPARSLYAQAWVVLDAEVLARLSARIVPGCELRVLRRPRWSQDHERFLSSAESDPGAGWPWRLPIVGAAELEVIDWDSKVEEQPILVVRVSAFELYGAIRDVSVNNQGLLFSIVTAAFAVFALIETLSLLIGFQLAGSITGSVQAIFDGTRRVERGDLAHRIPVTSSDQLGSLTQSFNRMTGSVQNLVLESAERERLEEELRIGRRIQQSLLPRGDFRDERFEISGLSLPAKEVGGDYFDIFDLGGAKLAILVADVSGKGTEAAFYMAEVKGIMLALARIHGRPTDVLREANHLLATSLDRRTFVTMTYGVLDRETGELVFSRAGHNPVLYLPAVEGCARSLRPPGLALGLDRSGRFSHILEEQSLRLEPGALVLLFTDGVTDSMSDAGELYGEDRLARALEGARGKTAEAVRDGLAAELRRFAASGPPQDDITIIVLRCL